MKVKALRNCMFTYEGTTYRVNKGKEYIFDIPLKQLDTRSFEVIDEGKKPKKAKLEFKNSEEVD